MTLYSTEIYKLLSTIQILSQKTTHYIYIITVAFSQNLAGEEKDFNV